MGHTNRGNIAIDQVRNSDLAGGLNADQFVTTTSSGVTQGKPLLFDANGNAIAGSDYSADTGAANTYAVTLSPAPTAYYAGMGITIKIAHTNTGASTINANSIGAVSITKNGTAALSGGELSANQIYHLVYDGTQFQIVGGGSGGGGSSPLTTKGDIWVYDTADTRLPVGTDGQVLTADSTQAKGLKWGAGGTGSGDPSRWNNDLEVDGGSSLGRYSLGVDDGVIMINGVTPPIFAPPVWLQPTYNVFAPPVVPNSMDDEFNSSSLDAKWTFANASGATPFVSQGNLCLSQSSGGGMITQPKPSAPCEFEVALLYGQGTAGSNPWFGICFADGNDGTHKMVSLHFGFINSAWRMETDYLNSLTSFSSSPGNVSPTGSQIPRWFMKIKDDGTNIIVSYALDGLVWTVAGTWGRTAFLSTLSHVGMDWGGATAFSVDFFRRTL